MVNKIVNKEFGFSMFDNMLSVRNKLYHLTKLDPRM